ncbi:hypothetical protein MTR67_033930 [Solanum verrucosum]|uniref:Uncharacterized protein n=1 Tax=Solanum verrucosum TaxID=315347 RepID=A0AAF0U7A9_SOLVR|nr:hypothetical protein MTR67_033930 [Solanum verrucosum]
MGLNGVTRTGGFEIGGVGVFGITQFLNGGGGDRTQAEILIKRGGGGGGGGTETETDAFCCMMSKTPDPASVVEFQLRLARCSRFKASSVLHFKFPSSGGLHVTL